MSSLAIFHISIEFWGIIFCLLATIGILLGKSQLYANRGLKIAIQICCIVLLVSDSLAWGFRGQPGMTAYYMVRISNYLVFATNYVFMSLFATFLWKSIAELDEPLLSRVYIIYSLSALAIILLTLSQGNNLFYYFDDNNLYHRSVAYPVTQLIAIIGLCISFTILIQYHKRLSHPIFLAMLSYFILPALATVIMVFVYGLSLQNIALVISTQLMFIVDMTTVVQKLDQSQTAYLQARHAASHDPMTGLWNKPSALKQIEICLNHMNTTDCASLLFVDIDDFKSLNDRYGHMTGDYWIKEIATLLLSSCRLDDIVCRFGGDEFLVFLDGTADAKLLQSKMHQFSNRLSLKCIESGQEVHCSVGICQIIGNGYTLNQCIETADRALYDVKEHGKNSCAIYRVSRDVAATPEKISLDMQPSFRMQEKFYQKIIHMFSTVLYYDVITGNYELLKENPKFHQDMPSSCCSYTENIPVFIKSHVSVECQKAVGKFLSLKRIQEQNTPVESVSYINSEGTLSLLHTFVNLDHADGSPHNCLIAIQELHNIR